MKKDIKNRAIARHEQIMGEKNKEIQELNEKYSELEKQYNEAYETFHIILLEKQRN